MTTDAAPRVGLTVNSVTDTRMVRVGVSDAPPLFTANGTRPIDPELVRISYALGMDGAHVEILGRKMFNETYGSRKTHGVRRYGPRDELPEWLVPLVEQYRPTEELVSE